MPPLDTSSLSEEQIAKEFHYNVVIEVFKNRLPSTAKNKKNKRNCVIVKCAVPECQNQVVVKMALVDPDRVFTCSRACRFHPSMIRIQEQKMEKKYGVTNVFQLDSTKEKCRKTWTDKYGTDNPFKAETVKQKIRNTLTEKYGADNPQKVPEIRERTQKTLKDRYDLLGFCNRETTWKTNLKKYGNKYYFASDAGKFNLQYYVNRFGLEKGPIEYKKSCDKRKVTLEKFIIKYGPVIGHLKYESWKTAATDYLGRLYQRHPKELADQIYEDYVKSKSARIASSSRSSLNLSVEEALQCLPFVTLIEPEFPLCMPNFQTKLFDFRINRHVLLEINGDYWHCNPDTHTDPDALCYHPGKAGLKTVAQIWQKDSTKSLLAEEYDYQLVTIWESELKDSDIRAVLINKLQFLSQS